MSRADGASLEMATTAFHSGNFDEARRLFAGALESDPSSVEVLLSLGNIALLANRLSEAHRILDEASRFKPDARIKALLAEVYYRLDDFPHSASLFEDVGRKALAAKLRSFGSRPPYKTDGDPQMRAVFIQTDPLPLIEVGVNGMLGNFLIDTGGSELILDTKFAERVGAARFGPETGTYAGGRKAEFEHGTVASIELGGQAVHDVPVHCMSTGPFSAAARGRSVDGILGTVLMYHFLTVLDYPGGEILLFRRGGHDAAPSSDAHAIPFWMAGDHFMVASGTINTHNTMLFVDTGLAGGAFTCPLSTIGLAGVKLEGEGASGVGGGGPVRITPFPIETLSLNGVIERDLTGLYGAFPPILENRFGFRIGGLISHGFLRNFRIVLDFQSMTMRLTRVRQSQQ